MYDGIIKNLIVIGKARGIIKNYEKETKTEIFINDILIDYDELIMIRNDIIHKYYEMESENI